MTWPAVLDDFATEAADTLRAVLLAIAKELILRTLRAFAKGIAFLAGVLEPQKKKKGLMLSGAERISVLPVALNSFERICPRNRVPVV